MLDVLFKRFVKEKTFLANVSPKAVRFYQQSYNAFKRTVGEQLPDRFLPISIEDRKVLYRLLLRHNFIYLFCTKDGTRATYRNVFRDFGILCKPIGIEGGTFHKFRHTFATEYLRRGGGELYLQKTLGHTALQMTRYKRGGLKKIHPRISILANH
jgi:integrase/recombinase XerD